MNFNCSNITIRVSNNRDPAFQDMRSYEDIFTLMRPFNGTVQWEASTCRSYKEYIPLVSAPVHSPGAKGSSFPRAHQHLLAIVF